MRILYFSRNWTPHDQRFLHAIVDGGHEAWLLRWENAGRLLPEGELPAKVQEALWGEPSLSNLHVVLDRLRPDLLHAGPVDTCGYLAALSGFHPFILMSWGSDILWDAARYPESRDRARVALSAADWLICDCREVRHRAAEIAEYPEERTVTFPWGIDIDRFEKSSSSQPLPQHSGWELAGVVLSMRSWEPIYGVDVAIDAFALASQSVPSARLVLAGDGSQAPAVKSRVLHHGLMSRTHLPGRIGPSELPAYYSAADVYLSCSYSDGSSVSLLEALAAGLPAVVTDIPGNREWIEPEVNGWLCPAGDKDAFACALAAALNLPSDKRSQMVERNRALARSRADWRLHAGALQQTYQRAADSYVPSI
ncbi:MAG TPA: glycosyltransferase [Bryobacteraceae bacterium]|nr:glycosyltransferase [Bryobacteraceae bacterium]